MSHTLHSSLTRNFSEQELCANFKPSVTGVGNMLNSRHQGSLCIRLRHRQLQAAQRGGGWPYEFWWEGTLGTLRAWVCPIFTIHGPTLRISNG